MSREEQRDYIKQNSKKLGFKDLMGLVDHYYEFEKKIEEERQQKEFDDRVMEKLQSMMSYEKAEAILGSITRGDPESMYKQLDRKLKEEQ